MKKYYYLIICFALAQAFSSAQTLLPLGKGFSSQVLTVFVDSTTGTVYAGGQFAKEGKNNYTRGIAQWNDSAWKRMGGGSGLTVPTADTSNYAHDVTTIIKYKDTLYAGGYFDSMDSVANTKGVAQWTGTQWRSAGGGLPCCPVYDSAGKISYYRGALNELMIYNNLLYAIGGMDTANTIAVYQGSSWTPLSAGNSSHFILKKNTDFVELYTARYYNKDLYVGGNFYTSYTPVLQDLGKWDSLQQKWVKVGQGLSGNLSTVNCLYTFNNELYVAGSFFQSYGDVCNAVMKWDGSQWVCLGNGFDNDVTDLVSLDGNLYALGGFTQAFGVPHTSYIARWDGTQWQSIGIAELEYKTTQPRAFLLNKGFAYKGSLYIAGDFDLQNRGGSSGYYNDGVAVYNPNGVGIATITAITSLQITISPNPFNDLVSITLPDMLPEGTIEIFNVPGQEVYKSTVSNRGVQINTMNWPRGMYVIKYSSAKKISTLKMVKE